MENTDGIKGGVMTEWISGWKKIAKYIDVSIRTAQEKAKNREIIVYKNGAGGVRADAKELDKHLKLSPIA